MDNFVFLAVLMAAAFHAGWNALVKLRLDPLLAVCLISVACAVPTLPLIPVVGLPNAAAWPYIAASLAIHLVYYIGLAEAYRTGDLGQVYPIARGAAPLMTAIGAFVVLGENLGLSGWLGVAVLAGGILLLSLKGGQVATAPRWRAVGFALLTAVSIALYTLVDGAGARLAGSAGAYIVWLFVLDALMMLAFGIARFGRAVTVEFRNNSIAVIVGGMLSCAAYAIAIWAMTVAPIALVAAVRETSVLFAALIGVVLLREPVLLPRIAAAALVVAGLVLVRLR